MNEILVSLLLSLIIGVQLGKGDERPRNYHFDVTIAGQGAEIDEEKGKIPVIPKPVPGDAEVSVDLEEPITLTVNLMSSDANGDRVDGGEFRFLKVVGNSFDLKLRRDTSLPPGKYLLNIGAGRPHSTVIFEVARPPEEPK